MKNDSNDETTTATPQLKYDALLVSAHLLHHSVNHPRGELDGTVADAWRRICDHLGLGFESGGSS